MTATNRYVASAPTGNEAIGDGSPARRVRSGRSEHSLSQIVAAR